MEEVLDNPKKGNWSKAMEEDYERIRLLGEGNFGAVWLAKVKHLTPIAGGDVYVAIKQVDATEDVDRRYADREIAILKEINHPNTIRCLRSAEVSRSRLLVLTLADGPDLNKLVDLGGALGTFLARLAARHLISAVAYLHGRGVIHRDIKPGNLILTRVVASAHNVSNKNSWMANDAFWDDESVISEKEWKVVLVDFGFAKALTPAQCRRGDLGRMSVKDLARIESQGSQSKLAASQRKLTNKNVAPKATREKSSRRFKVAMRRAASVERDQIGMSVLGTQGYAAPEVWRDREASVSDNALTGNASDYGLIADAYSVGRTIRALLTGIPGHLDETKFMSGEGGSIFLTILSALFSCGKKGRRRRRYKFLDEAPRPARELVVKLTRPSHEERITVGAARDHPWIRGGVGADDPIVTLPTGDIPAGNDDPIKCLDCAEEL